jgi:uncharacterized protein YdcH (DUF465 family)
MDNDDDIVSKLLEENLEFRKIKELHNEYERKLEDINKKHYLSDNEKVEKKNLKKKKLAAKDKLATIIKEYKSATGS